ncbi:adenosylcobinamide-GDP ribazoletransferase [Nocardioides ultimimeridianus]
MIRSLRLSVGMLTVLRVGVVLEPSRRTARGALLLAPIAVAPLGIAVGVILWAGTVLGLPSFSAAFLALGALALGTRALHLDGLSDVADGLTAPYGPERALAIMKTGASGPAGTAALFFILALQASALNDLVARDDSDWRRPLLACGCVMAARLALWITASAVVPPARPDGLGLTFTRTIPLLVTVLGWAALAGAAVVVAPVRGPVTVVLAFVAIAFLTWRCIRRFGGVTGDVFGSAIELAFAILALGAATL